MDETTIIHIDAVFIFPKKDRLCLILLFAMATST